MNGLKGGFDIKWVAANFSPDPKSKSGLWVRLKEGESASRVAMAGRRLGTMIGKGSVIAYPMEKAPAQHGGALAGIQYQQLGSAEVLAALQNGGGDSAWLLDPVWRKVDGRQGYAFLGGMLYGRTLLQDDIDAGVALLRAYIRTVNSYFASAYQPDATLVTYLSKLLKSWTGKSAPARRPAPVGLRSPGCGGGSPLPESRTGRNTWGRNPYGFRP